MALSCLLLVLSAQQAWAGAVDGMSGVLDVSGSLHNSPCVLDMTSAYQDVDLGSVSGSQLLRPGDQATPVAFQLRFVDCRRASGSIQSERTGNLVWSAYQPVVSVAFVAPADADDPRLVKVQGITGMGLLLTDALGRDAGLGSRGEPLFLQHGSDTLTWHVRPVRTSAALSRGAFRAAVDFRLVYE
ncbi:fimbrial protein [Pseudomonas deceptionensis]|uniref:Pilin (Type 1 fimbria component protein) n=1 Tax=Pseudomonas deceptionensis TaxID=882211 RepID=A0A1H5NTX8_PSEDM|nr:fimbrial protein [Pseudomonas deceptionensis]SEF05092.1 Pilin (type 1 fimbria component protein) [Pseudomonas deceptionensis]